MNDRPGWQYDETSQCGVDFSDPSVAAKYDENHTRFRDYKKGAEAIVSAIAIDSSHRVVDMGCGTGAFALHAAPYCSKVYAVDVSVAMLDYLEKRIIEKQLTNIECRYGGFLTYEHADEPVDAVVSVAVLHHLPDFWKLVGLRRVAEMLKPLGRFYLFDVVHDFSPPGHAKVFDEWIASTEERMGPAFAEEIVATIRDEYCTYDWIIEGMLERAGFSIDECKSLDNGPGATFICTKTGT